MGYSLFSVGETVQIIGGNFRGMAGIVAPATSAYESSGTVVMRAESEKTPVTVTASVSGHPLSLRVPPELLARLSLDRKIGS